jgi:RNA polymerase sigma factor FliA
MPMPQSPPLDAWSDAAEADLWHRLRVEGDPVARDVLIERHLPYARIVAASYYKRRIDDDVEFADYLQWASVALVESVDRYLPERGAQFHTFAARRMHGSILDGIERQTEKQQQIGARRRLRAERLAAAKAHAAETVPSMPVGQRDGDGMLAYLAEVGIGLAIGILLEGTGMVDNDAMGLATEPGQHYRQLELSQLRRRAAELMTRLPPPQRRVLQLHYLQDHSFVDIARDLELTKGRISQIHKQAIEALRQALRGRSGCDVTA